MIQRFVSCAAALFFLGSLAVAQVPPEPLPTCPDPVGVGHLVEIRGKILDNDILEFFADGTWENWANGQLEGWGTYEFDPVAGTIQYVNLSGDGGGNQTGTYTWDDENKLWDRTWASHPQAPPMRLIPPL